MRNLIFEALQRRGAATKDEVAVVERALSASGGTLAERFLQRGCDPQALVSAFADASGLKVASAAQLEGAAPAHGFDAELCWRMLAVPLAKEAGRLQVAFADPELAAQAGVAFPPHDAVLAPLDDVAAALERLFGRRATNDTIVGPGMQRGATASLVDAFEAKATIADVRVELPRPPGPPPLPSARPPPPQLPSRPARSAGGGPAPATDADAFEGERTIAQVFEHDAVTGKQPPVAMDAPTGKQEPVVVAPAAFTAPAHTAVETKATTRKEVSSLQTELVRTDVERFGRFTVLGLLGKGGMAQVYLARDASGRHVALKVLDPHLADDAAFLERFQRECRASSALQHDNVIAVYEFGAAEDRHYMSTEYVDGGTVKALLESIGRMPAPLAAKVASGVLMGLGHAHAHGIIHRDIKPANLMLSQNGVLKLGDFGIAKASTDQTITETGNLFGTPAYMAPEQALGGKVDARSDLFALGIVFYEMLTGTNPFLSETATATIIKVSKGQCAPIFETAPTVPREVERVVDRLLDVDPERRYQSAAEALADLRAYLVDVDATYPTLLASAVQDPAEVRDHLERDQAEAEFEHAEAIILLGKGDPRQAGLALWRATLSKPDHYAAKNALDELCAREKLKFEAPTDPALLDLLAQLAATPDSLVLLKRAGEAFAAAGHVHRAAVLWKRFLVKKPQDKSAQSALAALVGETTIRPRARMPLPVAGQAPAGLAREIIAPATKDESLTLVKVDPAPAEPPRPREVTEPPRRVEARAPMRDVRPVVAAVGFGTLAVGFALGVVVGGRTGAAKVEVPVVDRGPVADRQQQGLEEALRRFEARDGAGAVQRLTEVIDIDPSSTTAVQALLLRARVRRADGDVERAIGDYKSVLLRADGDGLAATEADDALSSLARPAKQR